MQSITLRVVLTKFCSQPCLEQTLESYELCCLVETFPARHTDLQDYLKTLKVAFLYAKAVALCPTHWAMTNRVMQRNRRIGCSISGVAQFLAVHSMDVLKTWLETGYAKVRYYDDVYSDWFAVKNSIKLTSVKPSGTVSLLAGATPGLHYPESRFYIRRIRINATSPLVEALRRKGHPIEPAEHDEHTAVVTFVVDVGEGVRTSKEVSLWEQLALNAFFQKYWSDNQNSHTVTFDPETEGHQIEAALNFYQYQLKGVSFLPRLPEGAYKQMPYSQISEERFHELDAMIDRSPAVAGMLLSPRDQLQDKFCDGDACVL